MNVEELGVVKKRKHSQAGERRERKKTERRGEEREKRTGGGIRTSRSQGDRRLLSICPSPPCSLVSKGPAPRSMSVFFKGFLCTRQPR